MSDLMGGEKEQPERLLAELEGSRNEVKDDSLEGEKCC